MTNPPEEESVPRITQEARRSVPDPDVDPWEGYDPELEGVDNEFIDDDVADLRTATRRYEALQPEDEKLFRPGADGPLTARHIVTFADLVAIARRTGAKVVEAPSSHRGHVGEMGTVTGVTCHWTGTGLSFRPSDEYPDYNVVKEGRAGLNNSLSAWGGGRYTTIFVISEDLSYHAGVWSYGGTTDGNGHFLGIEMAGSGVWTPFQRRIYPRLVASALLFINSPVSMAPTHMMGAMPRGRKSDFPTTDKGWLPDVTGGLQFHDAVAWLMKNPAYININYKSEPEDALVAVTEKDFNDLVAKVNGMAGDLNRLVTVYLDREYQRSGVLKTDGAQKAKVSTMINYAQGHALQNHRLLDELIALVRDMADEDAPAQPPLTATQVEDSELDGAEDTA